MILLDQKNTSKVFIYLFFAIMLSTCSFFTMPIYKFGIYAVIIASLPYILFNLGSVKKFYEKSKFEFLILNLFILFSITTTVLNYRQNFYGNLIVDFFVIIYFCILANSYSENTTTIKENILSFFKITAAITNVLAIIGLALYITKSFGRMQLFGEEYVYGVLFRSAGFVQIIGIYPSIAGGAIMSALSICIAIFFLLQHKNFYWSATLVLQFVFLSLSNNITSIAATIGVLFLLFLSLFQRVFKDRMAEFSKTCRIIISLLLSVTICIGCAFAVKGIEIASEAYYSHHEHNIDNGNMSNHHSNIDNGRDVSGAFSTGGSGRIGIWKSAIKQWKDKPILGVGYKNIKLVQNTKEGVIKYYNTHNGFIAVLVANGIIGFILSGILLIRYMSVNIIRAVFFSRNYYYLFTVLITTLLLVFNLAQSQFILERSIPSLIIFVFLGYMEKFYRLEKIEKE